MKILFPTPYSEIARKYAEIWLQNSWLFFSRLNELTYVAEEKENQCAPIIIKHLEKVPLLRKLTDTLIRNAGPTNLLQSRSQKQRNSLIDDLVNMASFGDTASKFCKYSLLFMYRWGGMVVVSCKKAAVKSDMLSVF